MSAKDAITGSAEDIIISTTTTGTMLTPEEQKEFSDLIDEYEDRSIALQQKIISLRRRMRNLINDHARNEKEIETLRKEVGELKVKLHAANAAIGGEEKAAGGFVTQSSYDLLKKRLDSLLRKPAQVVYVDKSGPERIVYVDKPGPERVVYIDKPGPERVVYRDNPKTLAKYQRVIAQWKGSYWGLSDRFNNSNYGRSIVRQEINNATGWENYNTQRG